MKTTKAGNSTVLKVKQVGQKNSLAEQEKESIWTLQARTGDIRGQRGLTEILG